MSSRALDIRIAATACALMLATAPSAGWELRICSDDSHALPLTRADVRRTPDTAQCDVVVGTPVGSDGLHRAPLDKSAYVFVYRPRRLRHLSAVDDARPRSLKIGVARVGHGAPPPAHTLARRGIVAHTVDVPLVGDRVVPERMIAALAAGTLDIATLWGRRPDDFTRRAHEPLALTTVAAIMDPSSGFGVDDAACHSADPSSSSFVSYARFRLCR